MTYYNIISQQIITSQNNIPLELSWYSYNQTTWAANAISNFLSENPTPNYENLFYRINDSGVVIDTSSTPIIKNNWFLDDGNNQIINTYKANVLKQNLIKEKSVQISSFWKGAARVMEIKNGHAQQILVDQDFANNINSAIQQATESEVYQHRLRDANNKVILDENGLPIIINISLNALKIILSRIEKRRGYCACAEIFHLTKLPTLSVSEIQNYNFMIDDFGNNYVPSPLIILTESGEIV